MCHCNARKSLRLLTVQYSITYYMEYVELLDVDHFRFLTLHTEIPSLYVLNLIDRTFVITKTLNLLFAGKQNSSSHYMYKDIKLGHLEQKCIYIQY